MSSPLGLINSKDTYVTSNGAFQSLFNKNKFFYRPNNQKNSSDNNNNGGNSSLKSDIYDISTNSIIEYCKSIESMALKYSDFMYHKYFGVYPNNRLIICRRFKYGVENDLTQVNMSPLATIVSWIPEGTSIMKFDFGEDWVPSQTKDPISLFDTIFKGAIGTSVGGGLSGLAELTNKAIPLGGVSEALQFALLKELGFQSDATFNNLPQGNPNFIYDAKERALGGLNSDISFDVEATYEQKFIRNLDPSVVFLDIINNILRFGSSESAFYITGSKGKMAEALRAMSSGDWTKGAGIIIGALVSAIKSMISNVTSGIKSILDNKSDTVADANTIQNTNQQKPLDQTAKDAEAVNKFNSLLETTIDKIGSIVIAKYRIQIQSVINSMTGNPSTPWHVTVGNPKKPIFSSGDMYVEGGIKVELGDTLSYNDLPATIKIKFTLKNARNLGIQEIFDRMNVGGARSKQKQHYIIPSSNKDYYELPITGSSASFMDGFNIGNTQKTDSETPTKNK